MRAGETFQAARDRALPELAARDRRLAYELAAGVLRRRAQLDAAIPLATTDPRLHDVLRLGVYQLRALHRVPAYAAVSTSVELAREMAGEGGARYVNRALRKVQRDSGVGARGSGESHPRWLVERWRRRFGNAETERLIGWNDSRPSLVLQPARWDAKTIHRRFQQAGVGVQEAPFGAGLVVVGGADASRIPHPAQLPGFHEGGFIVQDPGHALLCRYAAFPPDILMYDACAAPGGKAVALERNGVRVVAGEVRRDRMGRLMETTRRAGVAIRAAVADLLSAPFRAGAFAAVLVDAPCTATGSLARHPDARWRLTPRRIAVAAARQRALLEAAAGLVQPGGVLVYATCSLEPEENDDVVTSFLARHSDFARAPARAPAPGSAPGAVPAEVLTPAGDFQTLPQRHAVDGAYGARLVRRR